MIPEINKVLYTTDLSKNARHAFSYAASIANRYDAGVTILHVLEDISPTASSLVINIIGEKEWGQLRTRNEKEVMDKLRSRLTNFCDEVQAELPACPFITDNIIVKIGNPVDEILLEVENKGYDMVVMGAHGHSALSNALMGSTSRRVIRRCKTPVLVVRLPQED
ncbi:MAG: universal stress protein [Desulfobacterales bacterium]|jgi:nucleotide-binding universal stress UspA family protein|nr:universal stress protein [Desulfobacterales bacterium]